MEGFTLDLDYWTPHFKNKELASIYFGGGTPSLIGADAIATILEMVNQIIPFDKNSIEITLEANPETLTYETMHNYANAGINRISIGIQSLDDSLLDKLGRTHHAHTAIEAVNTTAKAGISNISVDLMYDIPGQTLSSWHHTLKEANQLPITHLSLYNLTIEPNTVFFKYRESLQKELPDAESSTEMYKTAVSTLAESGLIQYEISAFARNQCHSIHNTGYWTARPFIGIGPSAFSYWEGKRFRSIANIQRYVQKLRNRESPTDFTEQLDTKSSQCELLAINLRLLNGVNLKEFEESHGRLEAITHTTLKRLEAEGFLKRKNDTITLTEQGILFYDTVAVEII